MPPVQNNQPGTGFGSQGRSVGLVLSVTLLGKLPAPRIGARGAIWAHIQILGLRDLSCVREYDGSLQNDLGRLVLEKEGPKEVQNSVF